MRKLSQKLLAAVVMLGIVFAGCQKAKEENQGSNEPKKESEGTTGEEPALSEEAKKMKQFADLTEEETYALINIKDFGTITVKFFPEEAPLAVENFITHAKNGYYDGVTFHRIIDDFMIQGGDPTGTGSGGESIWGGTFADEFADDLHPFRGALCMAKTSKPDTNTSQFFIVQADAETILSLEELLESKYGEDITLEKYLQATYSVSLTKEQVKHYETYGGTPWLFRQHTVFGQVLDGYEVLDAVAGVKADSAGEPVVIESIEVLEYHPSEAGKEE